MSIKIAEIFGGNKKGGTIQGEGLFSGVPSVFVRVFGCNKTCKNFGRDRNDNSPEERFSIDPAKYAKYEELPLVKTSCDSYASWDPRFKHLSPEQTIPQIVDRIQGLLKDGKFNQDCHLILTGGEPLLGYQSQYPKLLDEIYNRNMDLTDLTFETNGTKKISDHLAQELHRFYDHHRLRTTFSVSAKLPCSGETWVSSILPDVIQNYGKVSNSQVYLKFVVATDEDLLDVHKAVSEYRDCGFDGSVYLMPVGGTEESYFLNNKKVSELAIEHGYRYSPRLQVDLFGNKWGT